MKPRMDGEPEARFKDMSGHTLVCDAGTRTVRVNQALWIVVVECDCGMAWAFRLMELKMIEWVRGYAEWLFHDDAARKRLEVYVNGVLVPRLEDG